MSEQDEIELDVGKLFHAFCDKILIVIFVAVLCAAAAYSATVSFIAPKYSASALLYVNSSNLSLANTKVSISTQDLTAAKSLVETYIVILKTRTTLEEVAEVSGLDYSYGQLESMISAGPVNNTEVFSVTVTCNNSSHAEILANTIAQLLPNRIASIVEGSSARIVDSAIEDTTIVSPDYKKNTLYGFTGGFLVTTFVILLLAMMDDKVRDLENASAKYQLPILAVIPDLHSNGSGSDYGKSVRSNERKPG